MCPGQEVFDNIIIIQGLSKMHATQLLSATYPDAGTRGLFVQPPVSAGVPRARLIRWLFCDNLASVGLLPADCISPGVTAHFHMDTNPEVCQNTERLSREIARSQRHPACLHCMLD